MTLKEFALSIDAYQLKSWFTPNNKSTLAKEHGIVFCFIGESFNVFFKGAFETESWNSFENQDFDFKKDGYFYGEEELATILRHNNNFKYNNIQLLFEDQETKATWGFATDIPHKTFRIFKGQDLHCLGLLFYQKDLV